MNLIWEHLHNQQLSFLAAILLCLEAKYSFYIVHYFMEGDVITSFCAEEASNDPFISLQRKLINKGSSVIWTLGNKKSLR